MYILDEPTTGLHIADVDKLITVLNKLADNGNTVVVIEHNLDVIKVSDYIIDLGPEGGDGGGTIVVTGTPEEVIKHEDSYTGQFFEEATGLVVRKRFICFGFQLSTFQLSHKLVILHSI